MSDSKKRVSFTLDADNTKAMRKLKEYGKALKELQNSSFLLGMGATGAKPAHTAPSTQSTADSSHLKTVSNARRAPSPDAHVAGAAPSGRSTLTVEDMQDKAKKTRPSTREGLGSRAATHAGHVAQSLASPVHANNAAAGVQVSSMAVKSVTKSLSDGFKEMSKVVGGGAGGGAPLPMKNMPKISTLAKAGAKGGWMGKLLMGAGATVGLGGVLGGLALDLGGQGVQSRYQNINALANLERADRIRGDSVGLGVWSETGRVSSGNTLEVDEEWKSGSYYKSAAMYGFKPEEAAGIGSAYSRALGGARSGGINPFALTLGGVSPDAVAGLMARSVGGGGLSVRPDTTAGMEAGFAMQTARMGGLRGSGIDRYLSKIASQVDALAQSGIRLDAGSANDLYRNLSAQGVVGQDALRLGQSLTSARTSARDMALAPLKGLGAMAQLGAAAKTSGSYKDLMGALDREMRPGEVATQINSLVSPELAEYIYAGMGANVSRGEAATLANLKAVNRVSRTSANVYTGGGVMDPDSMSRLTAEARVTELEASKSMDDSNVRLVNAVTSLNVALLKAGEKMDPLVEGMAAVTDAIPELLDRAQALVNL